MPLRLRCLFASTLCIGLLTAQSQLGTGALSGTVTDPGGDPVAGAEVMVLNSGTGLSRRITTGLNGQFMVPVLPTGSYSVRVEKAGFARLEQAKLVVNVGSTT